MTDSAEPRTTGWARPAVRPPSLLLGALEQQRALAELVGFGVSLPLFRMMPAGDGHPVLVLPGFMADDWSTTSRHGSLSRAGAVGEVMGSTSPRLRSWVPDSEPMTSGCPTWNL